MKISGNENEITILYELGQRIRQHRIALGITQTELAEMCGISASTETRIESGTDSKITNYIKILSGLNMLENFDVLIPEIAPDFKTLYEKKAPRQRAKSNRTKRTSNWTWEEDK